LGLEDKENLPIEPTIIEIVNSCKDILGDDYEYISQMDDVGDVIGAIYTVLLERGIDPPDEFLRFIDVIE